MMVWPGESVQVYTGSWAQDRPEGRGEMWWGEGRGAVYTGEWDKGRQHGAGVIRRTGDTEPIRANFRSETLSMFISLGINVASNVLIAILYNSYQHV